MDRKMEKTLKLGIFFWSRRERSSDPNYRITPGRPVYFLDPPSTEKVVARAKKSIWPGVTDFDDFFFVTLTFPESLLPVLVTFRLLAKHNKFFDPGSHFRFLTEGIVHNLLVGKNPADGVAFHRYHAQAEAEFIREFSPLDAKGFIATFNQRLEESLSNIDKGRLENFIDDLNWLPYYRATKSRIPYFGLCHDAECSKAWGKTHYHINKCGARHSGSFRESSVPIFSRAAAHKYLKYALDHSHLIRANGGIQKVGDEITTSSLAAPNTLKDWEVAKLLKIYTNPFYPDHCVRDRDHK